jgi:uncharacterized protein (DUF1015 family)
MAEIRSFRAWRYNDELVKSISELTSPLFDVASERQKAALYGNPQSGSTLTQKSTHFWPKVICGFVFSSI